MHLTIEQCEDRLAAIPGERLELSSRLGDELATGGDAVLDLEAFIEALNREERNISLALKNLLQKRKDAETASAEELRASRIKAAERALSAIRKTSVQIDAALDDLCRLTTELGQMDEAFRAEYRDLLGDAVAEVSPDIWCGFIHERLMQQAGRFSFFLQSVPNVCSANAGPVASWTPTLDRLFAIKSENKLRLVSNG